MCLLAGGVSEGEEEEAGLFFEKEMMMKES